MKLAIVFTVVLSGCAVPMGQMVYMGTNTVTSVVTQKSIPEHGVSATLGADCSIYNYVFDNKDYYCEETDVSKTYNRNVF
jgi:hypothetical protein